ncbi:MAG TPA: tetratricopeptide repeat protein [Ramlibacter sp.]|jgi:predicted negative regulator of RcsB-dependent stress response|uniref:YfgM family protein n=1 Tax=Ramlibacter sp. TaxID=1917967 RepID=UPI002D6623D8|nr:tetratricopeptide repeat protein [Ramlibacter sp.]HZY18660.1 tetratricopeptide repeat protein [Ramlibacter sp.]
MASHLDLEEQEQLDQLKHFWRTYGNLITGLLIAAAAAVAATNGWQYWQRTQSAKASALYDEVERAVQAGDLARAEQGLGDARERYGSTLFAQQAALLVAQAAADKGKPDTAKEALAWVADKASDEGYQAVARLRLAALHVEAKAYDEALKQLNAEMPAAFAALAADRRGDIYNLQGKKSEAKAEYTKAWQGLEERTDYRRLVEVKLTALGVDPKTLGKPEGGGAKS